MDYLKLIRDLEIVIKIRMERNTVGANSSIESKFRAARLWYNIRENFNDEGGRKYESNTLYGVKLCHDGKYVNTNTAGRP